MRGSFLEYQQMTLREVMGSITAYRNAEVAQYERSKSLAVVAGQVANMPYMSKSDQRRLIRSLETGESKGKDYSDEEIAALLEGHKKLYGTDATIRKKVK